MTNFVPRLDIRQIYDRFNASVAGVDCGMKCAPYNPNGKPFCCDICHAVPAVYHQEWDYLQHSTDLWRPYRGDECSPASEQSMADAEALRADTPEHMQLLACKGPAHCQREYRSLSCREFPFFPYITSSDRFIGLAYEWAFEPVCWVISNLNQVTEAYRMEFIRTYDALFDQVPGEYESYVALSEQMREHFAAQKRRIPLLHRNGGYYQVSPISERLTRVSADQFPKFGPYRSVPGNSE